MLRNSRPKLILVLVYFYYCKIWPLLLLLLLLSLNVHCILQYTCRHKYILELHRDLSLYIAVNYLTVDDDIDDDGRLCLLLVSQTKQAAKLATCQDVAAAESLTLSNFKCSHITKVGLSHPASFARVDAVRLLSTVSFSPCFTV